jgi:hypothetical protein
VAIIYRADLRPSKLELLAGWLPKQPWYAEAAQSNLVAVGAYRFDDPDGEVGIETQLLCTDAGSLLQAPFTYRRSASSAAVGRVLASAAVPYCDVIPSAQFVVADDGVHLRLDEPGPIDEPGDLDERGCRADLCEVLAVNGCRLSPAGDVREHYAGADYVLQPPAHDGQSRDRDV